MEEKLDLEKNLVVQPFIAADDGIYAGEPTECFNPITVVMCYPARNGSEPARMRTWWHRPGSQPKVEPGDSSAAAPCGRCSGLCRARGAPAPPLVPGDTP
jgi:hypothetical protein